MHFQTTFVSAILPLAAFALAWPRGGGGAGSADSNGSSRGSASSGSSSSGSSSSGSSAVSGGTGAAGAVRPTPTTTTTTAPTPIPSLPLSFRAGVFIPVYIPAKPAAGRGGSSSSSSSFSSSSSGGSYRGTSWSGSSFTTAPGYAGFLGGVYVGHGPFRGGADGTHPDDEPPADCVVAQTVNAQLAPSVDCSYTWEHWHGDNFLYYLIRISPTGQEGDGWAKGIMDNIKGQCGKGHLGSRRYGGEWHYHTNTKYGPPATVNATDFHGLEMSVPLGKWTPGADETECVAEAIRRGSCGVSLNFTSGTCYQKPGSMKSPVQFW